MEKRLWPLLLIIGVLASAAEKAYQVGTLTEVLDFRLNVGSALGPSHLYYIYRIQADDSTYSVSIARHPAEFGWTSNNSVHFRVRNQSVFLKCPDGTELKGTLLSVTQSTTSLPLSTSHVRVPPFVSIPVTDGTPPFQTKLRPGGVPMGIEVLHHNDGCAVLGARLRSGDFFRDLKTHKTQNGKEFRIKSHVVRVFPERMTVEVFANASHCASLEDPNEARGGVQPDFRFDRDFIQSLRFEGFWKRGFDLQTADVRVLTEAQTHPPVATDGTSMEYELEVWSHDIPLIDTLVISVLSPDGKLVTRFSASLLDHRQ